LAFRLSAAEGLCAASEAEAAAAGLAAAGLPVRLEQAGAPLAAERLLAHMVQDKKAQGGAPVLILARRIGEAAIVGDVAPARLLAFLRSEGAA
ncbi:MAG: 3-dehydroquinate synthase, partial [Caulobacteraceae bacterium]|nr:3-dehydroquinate synthase [Caulobacter sp.]